MSIAQALVILWRRGWIAALTLAAALAVALAVLTYVPSRYDAVATAAIDPGGDDPLSAQSRQEIGLVQGNMLALVQSHRVAVDVVNRLRLFADPGLQAAFSKSEAYGREPIEDWIADSISGNVKPEFALGTNVLSIKYKSSNANQSALIANGFLAAMVDAVVSMKASSAEQTAQWFTPQIAALRKEFEAARTALETFQAQTKVVAPSNSTDTEGSALMSVSNDLTARRAALTVLETRLKGGDTDMSVDPSDPDLTILNGLKGKLSGAQTELETVRTQLGPNNQKVLMLNSVIATLHKQIAEATQKQQDHLKARIADIRSQIDAMEKSQDQAQKSVIAAQAQRNKLSELQRDVAFRLELLNERERALEVAKLRSKLTFAEISILDKATPPSGPSFPKPILVIPLAVAGGLALGIILALLAEMLDRRVRFPIDLEFAASAPVLGILDATKRSLTRSMGAPRRLRPT